MAIRILRGASFALVLCGCGEERGPSAEAGDILVIQVVVAIIFEEKDMVCFFIYRWTVRGHKPAGMNWFVAVWGVDAIIAAGWLPVQ